ncbi:thiamine biosynthesis protein [Desulfocucumis palustris]|uniref:Thiamine biosynthesis protein n=1 Tax=Desulfocucumis palustris TaxID=1898651 RepID=A0A2L2X805_9FIRM|nr:MetQ/NlpA family ABC transporter substrate-binding protein [Desulfocucumis palustris]GBF32327.1 thiamine biosynthesis protein [Desulfocucumis palustris]
MFKSGKRFLGCMVILAGLMLAGCGSGEPVKLTLGMMPIADNLPFWVAEQKGYFKEEGLNIELVDFPSALERDSAFVAKQIDAGVGDMLAVAAMNDSGTKVKAVAVAQGVNPGENRFAVLSAPNSGITTPEQLKNQPIAMSLNTVNEYITDRLLGDKGLSGDEIKKTAIPKLPLRMEALMNGTVKAATLPDPLATLAEMKGAHLIVDNTENPVAQTVFIVRMETLEKDTPAIKKIIKAYSRAVADIQSEPGGYNEILIQKARVPEELLTGKESRLKFNYSQPVPPPAEETEKVLQWMTEHKLLKNKLSHGDLVDGRVLEK